MELLNEISDDIEKHMRKVRCESEEYFYMCSKYINDVKDAEQLGLLILKEIKLKQITLYEENIRLCDKGINYVPKNYNAEDYGLYQSGIKCANEARKITHENAISELRKDIGE